MPIYVGQPKKKFKVEVLYRIREKNVEVWFESPELQEMLMGDAESIIATELKRFPETILQIEQQ